MQGWTPLFGQILGSSIWCAPDHVRLAWVTLLAAAGRDGVAHVTTGGLAALARITFENAADALRVLSEPDGDTLTQENEGRRIVRVKEGWKLLNFAMYREQARQSAVTEQNREAQARWRARQKAAGKSEEGVQDASEVGGEGGSGAPLARTAPGRQNRPLNVQEVMLAMEMEGMSQASYPTFAQEFWDYYESMAREDANGKVVWYQKDSNTPIGDWRRKLSEWKTRRISEKAEKAAGPGRNTVQSQAPVKLKNPKSYGTNGPEPTENNP